LTLFGPLPSEALEPAVGAALQAVLDGLVHEGAPDAIAAVITPKGTWSGAAGIAGPSGRKATPRDEFAIASATKTFTAALVMRYVEQGRMDLDARLSTYIPDITYDTNGATVRQALAMLSGIPDFGPDATDKIAADPAHDWTEAELIAQFLPPTSAAGTTYIYSNPAYALVAFAARRVAGTSFADAVRKELLDRVAADRILEQSAQRSTPKPWAVPIAGHLGRFKAEDMGKGGAISCIGSASYSIGGASMASDAPSLAAWMWHLFAGDVITESSLRQMVPPGQEWHGLGLERLTGLGFPVYGHGGSKTGYGTLIAVFPADQTVVALFVNNENFVVEPAMHKLETIANRK